VPRSASHTLGKAEVGLLCDEVVVVVVVQNAELVPVGERGDEQVDGRESMVSDPCELGLGVEGMLASGAGGVASLHEEAQARREAPSLDVVRHLVGAFSR
jgi:hypothetical protein